MSSGPTEDTSIATLVDRMTTAEKIAQLGSVRIGSLLVDGAFSERKARERIGDGIGRVTRVGRESHLDPGDLATVIGDLQSFLCSETRPGIPAIVREESLCGYAGRGGSVFPQSIGLASAWDPSLTARVANATARQLAAVGIDLTLSPVADLACDPRWGRTEETYGEDPYLAAEQVAAYVEGLQTSGEETVHATLKHFVGHGASVGGRNRATAPVPPRELRERHCLPFEAGVRIADAASVMAAYHDIDGVPCHASRELLTDLLRDRWGFDGTVVSDGRGIELLYEHLGIATDARDAARIAIEAGIDIELPETNCFGEPLLAAVMDGTVSESRIDSAVRRHLRQKDALGLLGDDPPPSPPIADAFETGAVADRTETTSELRALAREAARKSIVLLENDGTLPLSTDTSHVAVIGPSADEPRHLLGNYSYAAAESRDGGIDVLTPLAGIRDAVDDGTAVEHVRGCDVRDPTDHEIADAGRAAAAADIAVVCLGGSSGIDVERDSSATSGEGLDRTDLGLPGRQQELVRRVHATGTPTVVVLINGRPLATEWTAEHVSGVIEVWLPGEEGGNAIADVLFGTDPGGRLPVSIPRSVGAVPARYDCDPGTADHEYVFTDGTPLYPFGHGESYTTFAYEDLTVTPDSVAPDDDVTVRVRVANVGDRPGETVVQLYGRDPVASRVRPIRSLVGFERVRLPSDASTTVTFTLPTARFAFYERGGPEATPLIEPGRIELGVGRSAARIDWSAAFEIRGERTDVATTARFTASDVDRTESDGE